MTLSDTTTIPAKALSNSGFAPRDFQAALDGCLATLLTDAWNVPQALAALCAAGLGDVVDMVAAVTWLARALGECWVADTCSFADVTFGLHRLTLLLFAIEEMPDPGRVPLHGGAVLLAPTPGDQHSFGLATVALALRRAGWDVTVELSADADALVAAGRRGYDCIGLSVGYDRAIPVVAGLIRRLRVPSGGCTPQIAVGGPMLARDPTLAKALGADVAAGDGFALAQWLQPLRRSRAA